MAHIRSLAGMSTNMLLQAARGSGAIRTILTRIRLVASVSPHVLSKLARLDRCIATMFTLEWLLAGVSALMALEQCEFHEGPGALAP